MPRLKLEQIIFTALIALVFAAALWLSQDFPSSGRRFPRLICIAALIISGIQLLRLLFFKQGLLQKGSGVVSQFLKVYPYIFWILGYYLLIFVFGFIIASALFIVAFLISYGKMRWYMAVLATVVVVALVFFLGDILSLRWPNGLIANLR